MEGGTVYILYPRQARFAQIDGRKGQPRRQEAQGAHRCGNGKDEPLHCDTAHPEMHRCAHGDTRTAQRNRRPGVE